MKYDQLVIQILETIQYEGNNQDYVNALNSIAVNAATLALFQSLPEDKKDGTIRDISKLDLNNQTPKAETLYKYFPKTQIEKMVETQYGLLVNSLIKKTFSEVDDATQEKITQVVNNFATEHKAN
jgi:hypothetical protein